LAAAYTIIKKAILKSVRTKNDQEAIQQST